MIVKIYSLLKFKNNGYQNLEFAFDELKKNINKKKRFSRIKNENSKVEALRIFRILKIEIFPCFSNWRMLAQRKQLVPIISTSFKTKPIIDGEKQEEVSIINKNRIFSNFISIKWIKNRYKMQWMKELWRIFKFCQVSFIFKFFRESYLNS